MKINPSAPTAALRAQMENIPALSIGILPILKGRIEPQSPPRHEGD